ncbi:MAG: hypothetical protein FVQ81_04040 [Candidatus Glassbacteria bacterium]|nr:hypothetical protein [Candidatus Glassbacteria bacterium]
MALEILPTLWSFLKGLLNLFKDRQSRKEKYDLELLQKRFEVYQEAYSYADKLKSKIRADEEKDQIVTEAKEWFTKNCLYLEPGLRKDFQGFIHEVWIYRERVIHWKRIGRSEGFETEEAKKLRKEIEDKYEEICSMQMKIQEDIDQYYQNI